MSTTTGQQQQQQQSNSAQFNFFKMCIGRPVVVKLNNGVEYRGILEVVDGNMNIVMEQTEEYLNGQLKTKYGDCFLRGNNVLYISAQSRKGN
ncbi:hypothetical protein SAMD00019534_115350 [Acytostelium subglobosum LB1]|uniref:hypothetical protein n=1 Tax=Acytostelium subglobosum LB1 TaxID=1410327 RepID=UPI000644DE22|nr:hypothetical protein SAMD00019534_115350 [Acytostelium subglobosum LB1]GAM28359.1 hypothetical protein SAMD00019534_115350 [Acytostelium subglobosum LB1]|eukprot:XP_012748676.1 hypothetical protein SAMD00019534_115350 [Acytostelium subglobosum LB1]